MKRVTWGSTEHQPFSKNMTKILAILIIKKCYVQPSIINYVPTKKPLQLESGDFHKLDLEKVYM